MLTKTFSTVCYDIKVFCRTAYFRLFLTSRSWCSVRCIFTFMKAQLNLLIIDLRARGFHGGCLWSDWLLGPFIVFRLTPALSLITLKMETEGSCTGVRIQKTITWAFLSFRYAQHQWVPVTTAWRVLGLRLNERPRRWRVTANILNKQSRTSEEGWSSSLEIGRDTNNSSP
jgi:hypothetical protein